MRKLRFLFLVFLLGGAWRLWEYNVWMALTGYSVEAQSPVLERRLWDIFPMRCLRFWPWMLKDAKGLKDFLERDMPVAVETRMSGLGRFETTIRWLAPWLKVQWGGRLWCVSREGRMWDLAEVAEPSFAASVKGPVWRLGPLEEQPQPPPSGVFDCRAFIPVEVIAGFLGEYEGCGWFEAAREVAWERRAGADLFRLKLTRGGQNFEVLIQRAKYAGQDLGVAVEAILDRLSQEGGNHLIDATYEGKILLRALPSGPEEGSLK
ncbi:MAG: hypothetical protein IJ702_04360 [Fretibacterium sp.]|nr:hypothetical protein [Fretibacterium sp.]